MTELLIGCPIAFRAWAIPAYMAAIETACARAEAEPNFIFVGDPDADPETWLAIEEHAIGPVTPVVMAETRTEDRRDWPGEGHHRLHRMVALRNELLAEVRAQAPRWFLSLDSDILLHPDALVNLLESVERFDAVGGRTYMSSFGTRNPSYAMLNNGALHRPDFVGVARVDVVMAVVLLSPSAYAVDYRFDPLGEDIGWSKACREARVVLGYDGRVASKHCMSPAALDRVDQRVGF